MKFCSQTICIPQKQDSACSHPELQSAQRGRNPRKCYSAYHSACRILEWGRRGPVLEPVWRVTLVRTSLCHRGKVHGCLNRETLPDLLDWRCYSKQLLQYEKSKISITYFCDSISSNLYSNLEDEFSSWSKIVNGNIYNSISSMLYLKFLRFSWSQHILWPSSKNQLRQD